MVGVNRSGPGAGQLTNSSGQVIGIGSLVLAGATNSVLLVGDSMEERSFSTATASAPAVDNGDGTATLIFGSAPYGNVVQTAVGDTIRVNNSSVPKLNQLSALVTAVDNTARTVTYTTTGPYSSLVGGNNPFIVLTKAMAPLAFLPLLNILVGGELEVVSNCTQGGARLEQIESIFDAIAVPCRFGIFLGGRNNFGANTPPDSYATVIAKAKTLIDKMVTKCIYPIIISTPPQLYSDIGTYPQRATIQAQYETWLAQYARQIGAIFINSALAASGTQQYRDAASSSGVPVANFSPDGTHQSGRSSYAIGKLAGVQIKPMIMPTVRWPTGVYDVYANDPSFVTDNSLLAGTGGTKTPNAGSITGNAPDSTTVAVDSGTAAIVLSSVARTVVDDGDTAGNWLRMVITNTAGVSSISVTLPLTTARVTNGDVIRALSRVRVSSNGSPGSGDPVGLIGLDAYCRTVTATDAAINESHAMSGDAALAQSFNEGFGVSSPCALVSPWVRIRDASHGAVSSGFMKVIIDFSGAGGATIDIAHPHIRKQVT